MPTFFQFSEKWKIHSHHQLQKILSFHFIICIFLFAEILVPLIIPSPFLLNLWEKFLSNDSFIKLISCQGKHYSKFICLNQFIPNAPFLYPLKTSENLTVFCFHGAEKGCIGNKRVNLCTRLISRGVFRVLSNACDKVFFMRK